MTYYNRDNLFNLPPIPKGQQGTQGATGAKGDEWTFGSSKDWLPGDVGYKNIPGLTNLPNTLNKWVGGVLAPNGKIYCVPSNSDSVLVIDPNTDTTNYQIPGLTGITGNTTLDKYKGGVLAPNNGKIYCCPYESDKVLVIDPTGNTYYYPSGLTGYIGRYKWIGAVLAPNGFIYCIPYYSNNVLVIDPFNDIGYINLPGLTNLLGPGLTIAKWQSGVLAQNGNIYCAPFLQNNVLVIDTIHNIGYTNIAGLTNFGGNNAYISGSLAPNGNIYFSTFSTLKNILVINPNTNIGTTSFSNIISNNAGFVLGQNGKLYSIPFNSDFVTVIDTINNTGSTNIIGLTGISGTNKFQGGVLTPNGKIYCVPRDANYVYKISTGLPKYSNWMMDPYFNKY